MAHCPTCGHDITQVRIVRNDIPLLFSACSQCDTTSWASAGETMDVEGAISAMAEAPAEAAAGECPDTDSRRTDSLHMVDLIAQTASINAA